MQGNGAGDSEFTVPMSVGDLLWNPKMGEGHVLAKLVDCGLDGADCGCGGWGAQPCTSQTLVCECGKSDADRDHHYLVLARKAKMPCCGGCDKPAGHAPCAA